ncbi:MAG: hypothetical protein V2A34_15945 [Lentisphaerota bacterium]
MGIYDFHLLSFTPRDYALGILVASASLLVGYQARAASVWVYGGNSVAALESATGQSSAGRGQSVDWKDGVFKPTQGLQAGGDRADLGIIRRQSIPPLEAHAMFSLNDVFGTTGNRPLPSSVIDQAWLWLYVNQANGSQTVTVRGLKPGDRDWSEPQASFDLKQNSFATEWTEGVVQDSFIYTYGSFDNPSGSGWFKVPVNMAQALMDYRDGIIGGIVFEASDEAASGICNFYFCSDENSTASRRPGLYLVYHEADMDPVLAAHALGSNSGGQVQATGASRVTVNGQDATYDFGGNWFFSIAPLEAGQSEVVNVDVINEQGHSYQQVLHSAGFAEIAKCSLALPQWRTSLEWDSSGDGHYSVQDSSSLLNPSWRDVAGCEFVQGTGARMTAEDPNLNDQGFYRVKETLWKTLP